MARGPAAPRPPRPRSPSALPPAPAPAPLFGGRGLSVCGRRSAWPPLGFSAAQRRCPAGIARRAPGVGPRALRLARQPVDRPALASSEAPLPSLGAGAARGPARPLPLS